MAYDPKAREGLTTITGSSDPNAQKFREIDPIGGALLGWGNTSWNNEIQRKNAKLAELKNQLGEERFNTIKSAVDANGGDWSQLGIDIFGDDGNKLDDQYSGLEAGDQANLKDLLGGLSDYTDPTSFFKDKNFMGDIGDVQGYQGPSSGTMAAQKDSLQQFKNLSNPTETAQEKLLRMVASREMENNLAGDRDALARSLKSRGVYGSGAEITGNMMAQGQAADRAALANMNANAQASKRAMDALGSYSDLAAKMRGAESTEGSLANQVAEFNNQTNQNTSNQRGQALVNATNSGNIEQRNRVTTGFDKGQDVNKNVRADIPAVNTAKTNFVTGSTGNRMAGAGALAGEFDKESGAIDKDMAVNEAKKRSSLL